MWKNVIKTFKLCQSVISLTSFVQNSLWKMPQNTRAIRVKVTGLTVKEWMHFSLSHIFFQMTHDGFWNLLETKGAESVKRNDYIRIRSTNYQMIGWENCTVFDYTQFSSTLTVPKFHKFLIVLRLKVILRLLLPYTEASLFTIRKNRILSYSVHCWTLKKVFKASILHSSSL